MAEAMTYTSLVSDIQSYADRNDDVFVEQIPRLVMLAENRLATEARGLGLQRYVAGTANSSVLQKPARWRETISLNITLQAGGTRFLKPRTYDYCRLVQSESTATEPRYYADYGYEHFLVAPTPGAPFDFALAYYERPEPLSATNETNWTTQYAPQLILYGTLIEAQPFLKRQERIQEFQGMYDRALQGLASETMRRMSGDRASSKRSGE